MPRRKLAVCSRPVDRISWSGGRLSTCEGKKFTFGREAPGLVPGDRGGWWVRTVDDDRGRTHWGLRRMADVLDVPGHMF